MATGKVFIIGGGCGSIDYLTVRGYQLLTQADVIVYDALVDPSLLNLAPSSCRKVPVGKRGGQPSPKQAQIDRLLVDYCQQGQQVVRLKSGDPFIFGRTTSEIQALKAAGCDFEVVPGLCSALAAPLLCSIPLTDLVLSRCFAVVSAHDSDQLDWQSLANLDTLVILMGGQALPTIVDRLLHRGKSPHTAIAIIRWAGQPQERIWVGELATIIQQTTGETLSPCVIVVGEVVRWREFLQAHTRDHRDRLPSFTTMLPLRGKTILTTRAASQASDFTGLLQAQGAAVIAMPTLAITPPSSWAVLDRAIAELPSFDWLILTSANAVDYFCDRLLALGQDLRHLAGVKIAVVGEKTAQRLASRGLHPDFIPPEFVADALVEQFPEPVAGKRLLFPRVETGGRDVLVKQLSAQQAEVVEVAAYQSGCPPTIDLQSLSALEQHRIDGVCFTSSKTVLHFCQLLERAIGPEWHHCLEGVILASIGPQTSTTCREQLGRVDVEAQPHTLEGLTQALVAFWAQTSTQPRR
jgi:uroporphyrinogen III methyltransferase/synthase